MSKKLYHDVNNTLFWLLCKTFDSFLSNIYKTPPNQQQKVEKNNFWEVIK